MKYLSLEHSEIKELINMRKNSILGFIVFFGLLLILAFVLSEYVLTKDLGISTPSIIFIMSLAFIVLFFLGNKDYLLDLIKKEKKVYKGVLASKSVKSKSGKYHFNVDGNIFVVDKETYDCYQEGDIIEVHISSCTKHLFKIEKVNE